MALNTYVLEGGVGKFVAFSAILNSLVEKTGEPVQIWGPHFQVFSGNPLVKLTFDAQTIQLDDPRITESQDIVYVEPYKNNFVKGDEHVIESFCAITGIDYDPLMQPVLYTDTAKPQARKWLKDNGIKGKYIVVQFTGGQAPMNYAPGVNYTSSNPGRNYPPYFVNQTLEILRRELPDVAVIDATLPNEPQFPGTIKCAEHWTVINELLKTSAGFISIDSCLPHFSATTGKQGVVIWGNTRWTQFGWTHNKNLTFHQKTRYNDAFKMDINDPRNLLVDPAYVANVFLNDVFDKPNAEEVACASASTD